MLGAWWGLNAEICQHCGRPLAVHDDQTADDYDVAMRECPAAVAIVRAKAEYAEDHPEEADAPSIEHARDWIPYTSAEGVPER